jgi:metal-responsive CopG/Arc/MetJ family transcriptional regulator
MVIVDNKIKRSLDKVRSSISFPQEIYTTLEEIAYEKKVSLAWVVRDAVEIYLKGQKEEKNAKNI